MKTRSGDQQSKTFVEAEYEQKLDSGFGLARKHWAYSADFGDSSPEWFGLPGYNMDYGAIKYDASYYENNGKNSKLWTDYLDDITTIDDTYCNDYIDWAASHIDATGDVDRQTLLWFGNNTTLAKSVKFLSCYV